MTESIHLSRVHAVDTDCGVSSRVAYSFQESQQDQFQINTATGDICLSSALDYERLRAHHVTIVAVDRVSFFVVALAWREWTLETVN